MKTSFGAFFMVLAALLAVSARANAAEPGPRILVSVGETGSQKNSSWRRHACAQVHQIANREVSGGLQVTCRSFDALQLMDTYLQQLKKDNVYHLRLLRGYKGSFKLSITNWRKDFESDFTNVAWNIRGNPSREDLRSEALQAVLQNFFRYVEQQEALKTHWLANAIEESRTITYDYKNLVFKSSRDKKIISLNTALKFFEAESERKAHYLRTRLELALMYSSALAEDITFVPGKDSMETVLMKAARSSVTDFSSYDRVVFADEKFLSPLTVFLFEATQKDSSSWQNFSDLLGLEQGQSEPQITPLEPLQKSVHEKALQPSLPNLKSSGKLIYLF